MKERAVTPNVPLLRQTLDDLRRIVGELCDAVEAVPGE
jgi:hypothetical protein